MRRKSLAMRSAETARTALPPWLASPSITHASMRCRCWASSSCIASSPFERSKVRVTSARRAWHVRADSVRASTIR